LFSKEGIKSTIQTLIIAFILSIGIRTYVAEAKIIPTGSMIPTIKIGERVLVDKVYYKIDDIERKDIIVFKPTPTLLKEKYTDDFIKRVIGKPGDTIQIEGGKVYINDEPLREDYIKEEPNEDFGPFTVPPNSVFVMGDNRNNSYDSRKWGVVPMSYIKGRAILRFWPIDRIGLLER
jgi:signal peptidase I